MPCASPCNKHKFHTWATTTVKRWNLVSCKSNMSALTDFMLLPAAWLSPPATPWQLYAEPSAADHPVSCPEGANPGAPCLCGCQVEGGLRTAFPSVEPCPYQEAWAAWASEALEAWLAPRTGEREMQGGKVNLHLGLSLISNILFYRAHSLHLSTANYLNLHMYVKFITELNCLIV